MATIYGKLTFKQTGNPDTLLSKLYLSGDGFKYQVMLHLTERVLYLFKGVCGARIWDQKARSESGLRRAAKKCLAAMGVEFEGLEEQGEEG